MRTNANIARLPIGDARDRPATTCIDEAVQRVRPIEAWLIAEDARRLREHLAHCATVRAKLADAVICDPRQVGPDVATGYSLVIYAVDGLAPQSQVLSHWRYPIRGGFGLSICTLLGATLLGMKAGQRSPILRADGTSATVQLLGIAYRPEALFRQSASIAA
jgi:hypothetical protein